MIELLVLIDIMIRNTYISSNNPTCTPTSLIEMTVESGQPVTALVPNPPWFGSMTILKVPKMACAVSNHAALPEAKHLVAVGAEIDDICPLYDRNAFRPHIDFG